MTIIGVSDEASAKVKGFVEQNGIKYTIAIKGADEYKTSGIPRAWLVSPRGEIVWEGHPGDLKEPLIEEHLKGVTLTPTFSLPKDLKSAEKELNAGRFSDALKALETHLKKPKSPETESAARETIEKVKAYGASRLQRAEEYAKEREYGEAAEVLKGLEKSFKGLEAGEKARETLAAWKKDEKIKLELDGSAFLEKAEAHIQAKQYKNAAGFLLQITKPKKFEGTKVREIAAKKLAAVERKL